MRTSLFLSFGLVHDQRGSHFSSVLASQSGCLFSKASLLFNFMQFSFKWPVSFPNQQESSGSNDPSTPRVSCRGLGFPRYGLPVWPLAPFVLLFWGLLPPLATACVIVWTRNLGSTSWFSFWFWASMLLILDACWSIWLCLCQEFFDSLGSCNTSDIVEAVVSIAVAQELIFPDLLQLPKVKAKWPQNWVRLSVVSEICNALQAMAA